MSRSCVRVFVRARVRACARVCILYTVYSCKIVANPFIYYMYQRGSLSTFESRADEDTFCRETPVNRRNSWKATHKLEWHTMHSDKHNHVT